MTHHTEAWTTAGVRFGWQCLTCRAEEPERFPSISAAEADGDLHVLAKSPGLIPADGILYIAEGWTAPSYVPTVVGYLDRDGRRRQVDSCPDCARTGGDHLPDVSGGIEDE